MGFFDKLTAPFQKKAASNIQYDQDNLLMRALGKFLRPGSYDSISDSLEDLVLHGYVENPHARTVIDFIAGRLSQIKPIVYIEGANGELEEAPQDDELAQLMKMPNEGQHIVDFSYEAHAQYNMLGNHFLYGLEPEGFTAPTKLYNMPAQQTEIVTGGWRDPITGYFLEMDTQKTFIPSDYVMHRKQYNPIVEGSIRSMYGLSKMKSLVKTLNRSNHAYDAGIAAFANGTPSGILSPEIPNGRPMTAEENKAMDKVMKKRFGGGDKHKKIIGANVALKWTPMGLSPAELDLLNSNQFDLRDFCRVYGFSSVLVSDTTQSKHDVVTTGQKEFWENVGIPQLNDYMWCLNKGIAAKYRQQTGKKYKIWYDLKDIGAMQESLDSKQDRLLNELNNNLITFGEYHKKMGQEMPEAAHMDLYVKDLQVQNNQPNAEDN